jgi:CheY-like chemotaxis protein
MKKIAVVEDNPDNMMLVEALLEDDYELQTYESGKEALAGLQTNKPDLILLDISLPEMDGTQILAALRANPTFATLPIIALTAHAMASDREKYLGMGFDGYVTKPIEDESILFDAIEALLTD